MITLNDHGQGSLRAAVEASGPRIIVFRVAGEIALQRPIGISNSFITIAGQTAPGDGITLRDVPGGTTGLIWIGHDVHDVIIRYLKLRKGKGGEADDITIRGGHNLILDHLSFEWATDEILDINPDAGQSVSNITIQHCILAEALRPHSTGILLTYGENAGSFLERVSLHHNLFAHNAHRNPNVTFTEQVQVVNNVVYNWRNRVGETVGGAKVDYIGNYFKAGPWSGNPYDIILHEDIDPNNPGTVFPNPSLFTYANVAIPLQKDYPTLDEFALFRFAYKNKPELLPKSFFRSSPLTQPSIPVAIEKSQAAFDSVLADVGDNARLDSLGNWVRRIDTIDNAIIQDVKRGTGPSHDTEIDHQQDFGGYPTINLGTPSMDTDHDGMPDEWEIKYGLNPNDASDGTKDMDGDGYTNVEEFLNGTEPTRASTS